MSCTNLRYIELRRKDYNNAHNDVEERVYKAIGYTSSYLAPVPCGKCAACLKARQNDLASRCVQQAKLSGSMQFLTLTYDEQHLPLSMTLESVDKSTGEVFKSYSLRLITRQETLRVNGVTTQLDTVSPDFVSFVRESLSSMRKDKPRYVYRTIYEDDSVLYRAVVTPSLNPRDVRLWLKSARVRYQREYGVKLPDFKYVVCGEMGTHTHRPHYHLCFFGLSNHDVRWLAHYWTYGFTYLKTVRPVNHDGTSGFEIAARYVSKYMTKGEFECESVRCGYAYKSRLMSSKGLGGVLPEPLINYFRAYDVMGKYDINKVQDEDFIHKLLNILKLRNTFSIGGKEFRLPNAFIRQIWYVRAFNSQGAKSYKPSIVRAQITFAIQSNFFRNDLSVVQANHPEWSVGECIAFLRKQENISKACLSVQNERGMQAYKKFYLNSKF